MLKVIVDIYNTNKKYSVIYADPPWEYKESGGGKRGTAGLPYDTMTTQDICNLPVQQIAADTSILFIWATFRKLKECLKVIDAWGFEYYGLGFDWVKTNSKTGTVFWGMGYYSRQNTEICLIGVKKDKTKRIKPQVRNVLSVVHSAKREHSRKPDEIRDNIVKICGDLSRIELFARNQFEGWDCWGKEAPTMEETKCKACGKPIIFIKTLQGKNMPCDAATVYFVANIKGAENFMTMSGVPIKGRRVMPGTANSVPGYVPHWATCTEPDKFREPKGTPPAAESASAPPASTPATGQKPSLFRRLQELMKNRVPILFPDPRSHEDIEYQHISGIITRYNDESGKYEIQVELYGTSGHDVLVTTPDKIKVKEPEAAK